MNKISFRCLVVYALILSSLCVCSLRICTVGGKSAAAIDSSASKSVDIATSRGVIYDRNFSRLTCDKSNNLIVAKPSVKVLNTLKDILDKKTYEWAYSEFEQGNPIVVNCENKAVQQDILNFKIYKRYNNTLAMHLIGYLDSSQGNGLSGVEKAYNDVLSSYSGRLFAKFIVKANGEILPGAKIKTVDEGYNSSGGVVLTVDKKFQYALESAMDECGLIKGAAVTVNANTGEVVACVSRPLFDRDNLSESVNDLSLPLFNRAFGAYPVGSVFKPLIALCALEQDFDPAEKYECCGYTVSGGITFNCMNTHGQVDMAQALMYSCNCYFIELFARMDKEAVLQAAVNLGFGSPVDLSDRISTYSGFLPAIGSLSSPGAAANFSFGQGELSANIFQVASLYCAIANGGKLCLPYLVKGYVDPELKLYSEYVPCAPFNLFEKTNANIIGNCLELAVREGTGKNAAVGNLKICGKTASAQSGDFSSGEERIVSWFAGFFAIEEMDYVTVILCEDGKSGSSDCAPVFSKAVSTIYKLIY